MISLGILAYSAITRRGGPAPLLPLPPPEGCAGKPRARTEVSRVVDCPRSHVFHHALLGDVGDDAGPHRPAPLPDRKPQLLLQRDRRDQLPPHRAAGPPSR